MAGIVKKNGRRKTVGRKAYVRTIESFFAFFITFIFVVFVVYKGVAPKPLPAELDILPALEQRDDFRNCVYAENSTCIEDIVDPFIPSSFNHKVAIGAPEPFKGAKDIYTETIFIVSNQTSRHHVVYLYYWPLSG
ncbi:hypothetical protein KY362_06150 [Candidatus Woesearchaeota archaeon]|nr:hypothetical protein [Candidatus Woesearchaeota archaeon]